MLKSAALINHFPYLGVFLLLILGGIGFPFPEDTTLMLSGFLIAHDVIQPLPAFLVIYTGLLITDFFLYLMGRKYGRMLVEHKRFRRIISSNRLSELEEKFKKRGVWVVLVGRHLLGLRAQIFLVAGVMRMSAIKFLMADAVTALLTIALMGGIGYAGGNSIQVLKKDVTRIEHIAILVFMVLLASWIIFKYFKNREILKKNNG
jgi:membrane protein DedA with SNARE-associated domain